MMPVQRLDKLIAAAAALSRSQARACIRAGRVTVDGACVEDPEARFDPAAVCIALDGASAAAPGKSYYMLHKPAGVVSATQDADQPTVLDLLPEDMRRRGLFPVGRLDKDTTGLILLTDDGDFAHRVISPRAGVAKTYRACFLGALPPDAARRFREGIALRDGTVCQPALLEAEGEQAALVTLCEGKYHQVRRMLASLGCRVTQLHRLSVGALRLPEDLAPGEGRVLTKEEAELVFGGRMPL